MTKETWLPRFTAEDIKATFIDGTARTIDVAKAVADGVNKRLEEFEAGCTKVYRSEYSYWSPNQQPGDTMETICLPPRPTKRGVKIEKVLEALRHMNSVGQHEIADRIEREGIINE